MSSDFKAQHGPSLPGLSGSAAQPELPARVSQSQPVQRTAATDALAREVQRAQAGDAQALRRVLDAVAPEVSRVVRTVLGSSAAELDDAIQESLLAFMRALSDFRGECGVRRFAHRIAVRSALAVRRRSRSRQAQLLRVQADSSFDDSHFETPHVHSLAARRRQLLRELIDELPEAQAETLALRVVLGMSLLEVAEATATPVNTVRSRLRLAREALRARIEAEPAHLELLGGPL